MLEFEEQTNSKAVFKEELVEDIEITGDYFMTVAMDYVLSKFIVLIAHPDVCITCIWQSHLYGVGELGGLTMYAVPLGSWWGKESLSWRKEQI